MADEELDNLGQRAYEGVLQELAKTEPERVERARRALRELMGPREGFDNATGVYHIYLILRVEAAIARGAWVCECGRINDGNPTKCQLCSSSREEPNIRSMSDEMRNILEEERQDRMKGVNDKLIGGSPKEE